MAIRRLEYVTLLLGAFCCYLVSGEWLTMLLLLLVLGLPFLSALVSLPAVLTLRVGVELQGDPTVGQITELWLQEKCPLPVPPVSGRLRLQSCYEAAPRHLKEGEGIPAEHCGGWEIRGEKVRVCDYLGLFSLPVRLDPPCRIPVRPVPVPLQAELRAGLRAPDRWVPKPGGGPSENHEHRSYRPGDPMNQIHWKLSAKMDDYIVREPMQPARGSMDLALSLMGTPEELDRKLGRLLWTGEQVLSLGMDVHLSACTAAGIRELNAGNMDELLKMVDTLLFEKPAAEEPAQWREDDSLYLEGNADEG